MIMIIFRARKLSSSDTDTVVHSVQDRLTDVQSNQYKFMLGLQHL